MNVDVDVYQALFLGICVGLWRYRRIPIMGIVDRCTSCLPRSFLVGQETGIGTGCMIIHRPVCSSGLL